MALAGLLGTVVGCLVDNIDGASAVVVGDADDCDRAVDSAVGVSQKPILREQRPLFGRYKTVIVQSESSVKNRESPGRIGRVGRYEIRTWLFRYSI